MMNRFDVIVLGCGIGGYNIAIRASQLRLSVAVVERGRQVGGGGILTGCIPSQALLHASQLYEMARAKGLQPFGIDCTATLNLQRMMAHKEETVRTMSEKLHHLLRKQGVMILHGEGSIRGPGRVAVRQEHGAELLLEGRHIVVATGSMPITHPVLRLDHGRIIDVVDALALDAVPQHLVVIGAGVTGVEIGCIWRRLGARVTLIDHADRICPWLDRDVAAALLRGLKRRGIAVRLSTKVVGVAQNEATARLELSVPKGGPRETLEADRVVVCIGRTAAIGGLGLDNVGYDDREDGGWRDGPRRAGAPAVWIIGDAAGGPMLVSKAEDEAIACAEQIAGLPGFVNYAAIPIVMHTSPDIAMIGRTEEQLQAAGVVYRIGQFALAANAHAIIERKPEGFIKLLVDARTNLLLGAHLIGGQAAEQISGLAVAMDASAICEDIARTCHPYPTGGEALRQAAMSAGGWMMHA